MRNNLFKYIFIVFVVIIMVFAIYKIRTDEEQKSQMQQTKQEESEQSRIKEINLGVAEYDTMNPIVSNNKNVQDIQKLIYEPLISLTTDYKLEPCLATEWAKQNETTYIIKLRENVKWANGKNFTAEDVRFTIDRLKDTPSIYSYNVEAVVQVDVIDEHTLTITLGNEVPFFEYNLTFPIVEAEGYANEAIPGGTGKYTVTGEQDENLILEKNQNWWGAEKTKLSLEKITINKYATLGEMYNAFKIGNVDMISTNNTNLQQYIGKIGYNEKQIQGREHTFLAINTQNNILQSPAVRKAIAYSIDRENIVSSIFNNQYYTSSFPLEYGTWVYQAQNPSAGYNPEQAKQELTQEGWINRNNKWQKSLASTARAQAKNRTTKTTKKTTTTQTASTQVLECNLLVKASDGTKVAVAQNIQEQLASQGITLNIVQASDEQYTNSINAKNYDIALCSINMSPSPNMETFFGNGNLANYATDEVNELMKEVKNTTDEEILKKDYQRLSEIYKTEIPYISLYTNRHSVVYGTSLLGEFSPNWYSSFYGVETWGK